MDMVFLAKDNEHHKVVVQHMNSILFMLLLTHFYSKLLLEPIYHPLNNSFLDNKPENQNISLFEYSERKI